MWTFLNYPLTNKCDFKSKWSYLCHLKTIVLLYLTECSKKLADENQATEDTHAINDDGIKFIVSSKGLDTWQIVQETSMKDPITVLMVRYFLCI